MDALAPLRFYSMPLPTASLALIKPVSASTSAEESGSDTSADAASPVKSEAAGAVRAVSIAALALVALYVFGLLALYGKGAGWLIDHTGQPRSNEYVGVRAAGELTWQGKPAAAYDWAAHEAQTAAIVHRAGAAYFPWPYPPTYLMVAAALASVPFVPSALFWIAITLGLYVWSVGLIARARVAALWAAASPATAFNAFVAHTGFWTAAVTGLALNMLPKRPILAGVLFAVLTQKPQLGILVPVALIAGGYWRTCLAAGAMAGLLAAVSLVFFGIEPWQAFLRQMPMISDSVRFGHPRLGDVNFDLLVSAYGFLRACGAADSIAISVQSIAGLSMVVAVTLLWRSGTPYALKAAGLVSASLLATPYLFIYDLTHLSVAIAFLVQHTGFAGLTRNETIILSCSVTMILLAVFVPLPVGFLANLYVGMVIAGRVWSAAARHSGSASSVLGLKRG
jgi:arabinofuranan 3-O-arabinosyltransferase